MQMLCPLLGVMVSFCKELHTVSQEWASCLIKGKIQNNSNKDLTMGATYSEQPTTALYTLETWSRPLLADKWPDGIVSGPGARCPPYNSKALTEITPVMLHAGS